MKKGLVLVAILLLSACDNPPLDIRQELLTTLRAQRSFTVEESFEWNRFATLNDAPWNLLVELNTTIDFENNRYFVDHQIDEETNINRVVERTLFDAASYKNIYSRNAAIRVDRQWYNLELPLINAIGLGSIDPVYVVSELLLNNSELYYKSDAGVTGDISSFRIAVVTIPNDVFEDILEHTVAPYVDFPYTYTVTAELRFNDAYEITSIAFDLNHLLRQYEDYFSVQQGAMFNSLSGSYSLEYRNYNAVNVSELPIGITFQPSTIELADVALAVEQSTILQPLFTTVVDQETGESSLQTTLVFEQAGRIALIEVIGISKGQIVFNTQQQIVRMRADRPLQLEQMNTSTPLDELYITIRYLEQQRSNVVFETLNATALLQAYFGD
jgi:hypothetical protein